MSATFTCGCGTKFEPNQGARIVCEGAGLERTRCPLCGNWAFSRPVITGQSITKTVEPAPDFKARIYRALVAVQDLPPQLDLEWLATYLAQELTV